MWNVEYKKRFLKELSKLPEDVQEDAEKIVFEDLLCENPFDLGYLEQMKGYPGKYKFKLAAVEGEEDFSVPVPTQSKARRVIPTSVKLEVWKRDGG